MSDDEGLKNKIKCPMCGLEFTRKDASDTCGGCAMKKVCSEICCPNCGFKVVP